MAMLFHDEKYMTCPSCGATTMTVDKVYRFMSDKKEPNAINGEYLHTRVRCSECGTVCRVFRQPTDVRVNR